MTAVRILIADDHDVVREGLKALLASRKDFLVCGEAITGREAVAKARALKPNVVVLDFSLPELNGLDAARRILKEAPGTEVLILTMHDSETLAREVLAVGALGFLVKTQAKAHLAAAVEALTQHKPYFAGKIPGREVEALAETLGGPARSGVKTDRLTPREREVVQLIAEGKSNKEVARLLGLSIKTADAHRSNIMRKLDLHSVSELVLYAVRNRIVQA